MEDENLFMSTKWRITNQNTQFLKKKSTKFKQLFTYFNNRLPHILGRTEFKKNFQISHLYVNELDLNLIHEFYFVMHTFLNIFVFIST